MRKLSGIFVMAPSAYEMIYGCAERTAIAECVELVAPLQTPESIQAMPQMLADIEVLFSGWGGPKLDEAFCDLAPRLRAVFYAAGSVASILTRAIWERDIVVTSAYAANAVPVAEYTLAMILFSLKHGWALSRQTVSERRFPCRDIAPGVYGSTVGLISLGMIARTLLRLLAQFDLKVIAYDPFVSQQEAANLGVELVSLDEVFQRSQVVSLHSPLFPETQGMVTGAHLWSMRTGATFINTSRGQVINEPEMIDVLKRRPDLYAVLDVTHDEPPATDSLLYSLPNVTLTPHIAGSVGRECQRMGKYMVGELNRFLAGKPLQWEVTPELALLSSHRPVGMTSVDGIKVKIGRAALAAKMSGAPLAELNGVDRRSARLV
jgi:phosphoglycerate dehydrogenase-like enzyme